MIAERGKLFGGIQAGRRESPRWRNRRWPCGSRDRHRQDVAYCLAAYPLSAKASGKPLVISTHGRLQEQICSRICGYPAQLAGLNFPVFAGQGAAGRYVCPVQARTQLLQRNPVPGQPFKQVFADEGFNLEVD